MGSVNGKKCLTLKCRVQFIKAFHIIRVSVFNLLRNCTESDCSHSPAAYALISKTPFKKVDSALLFIPSSAR